MKGIDYKNKTALSYETRNLIHAGKGSITVEAAIVLPVFLCMVLSLVSFIKIVYTYEIIQCAMFETADVMASSAYLLRVSGLQDINASINDGPEQKSEQFESQIKGYTDLYEVLSDGKNVIDNPVDELESIAAYMAKGVYGDLKSDFFNPVARLFMKKYISSGSVGNADDKLKALNVHNGFEGLDFSKSEFFENDNDDIKISVRYIIDLPLPIKVFPDLVMEQSVSVKAWMGGDAPSPVIEGENSDDIWSLDNFSRGRIIRNRFGANLPFNFPVISSFDNGKAVMIKSLDTTAVSYQTGETLTETLTGYITELAKYKGQAAPWGSGDIIIREDEILQKELLLVIPQNTLTAEIQKALEECIRIAAAKGIKFKIERYGTKKNDDSNKTDNQETQPDESD